MTKTILKLFFINSQYNYSYSNEQFENLRLLCLPVSEAKAIYCKQTISALLPPTGLEG